MTLNLHCLTNKATRDEALFADCFAMAEDLRAEEPDAFRLLCNVRILFRFHDRKADLRVHKPVITLAPSGDAIETRYNPHSAGIFDVPAAIMGNHYRAACTHLANTRCAKYRLVI